MTFFLFPGQGSQAPGMGLDFYEGSPAARAVLDEAAQLAPAGFLDTVFHGDVDALKDTRIAQPALLAVGVAIARHLESLGVKPSGCAGHSLGEITALAVGGTLTFADAFRITCERARLMAEAAPSGGMAAVVGMEPVAIEQCLPEGVTVANYNGPSQTIISGDSEPLAHAIEVLKDAGAKRVLPLPVSGPFHSPLMAPAAQRFEAALKGVAFGPPSCRFVSSVTGQEESDPETMRALLVKQLYSPVRWTETLQAIGLVEALEAGPGRVLQGLSKRMEGAPSVTPVGTLELANTLEVAR